MPAFPKHVTNGLCCGPVFVQVELVVPAVGTRTCCHSGGTLGAVADSSGDDHGCAVGCRQGELLAHGLWDENLTSFSSTPVWDAKDALIIRAGWKFLGGMLLCWKMLILRVETFHRNMLIPMKVSMESRQAGCPGSLCSWLHASLGFPGSLLPRQLLLQLPDTLSRPLPQQWGGWGAGNIKCQGTDPLTITSFHRRGSLFSQLIYQQSDTNTICFPFPCTSHTYKFNHS